MLEVTDQLVLADVQKAIGYVLRGSSSSASPSPSS